MGRGGTRPPHVQSLPIIDSVTKILAKNRGYDGVTYFRSSGNTFKLLQTPAVWGQGASPKMPSAACNDPKTLDRLFSPFFTSKPSGMGMGLSICRSIIEAHGGRTWTEANLPHGAAFHFTLPLHQEGAL
jgi:Histidine kinase-, DNA gyrase B-, and HSP90-like ATPase